MLVRSTRTEFRMLIGLLIVGLAIMALTGCVSPAPADIRGTTVPFEAAAGPIKLPAASGFPR